MRLSHQLYLMAGFLAGVLFTQFARPVVLLVLLGGAAYAIGTHLWNRKRNPAP